MPKSKYKQLIKRKIKDYAFKYLMEKKETRNGKGKEIKYTELKMQNYLQTEDLEINSYERKVIFQLSHTELWLSQGAWWSAYRFMPCW